jgi:hypothetical protein
MFKWRLSDPWSISSYLSIIAYIQLDRLLQFVYFVYSTNIGLRCNHFPWNMFSDSEGSMQISDILETNSQSLNGTK